MGMRLTCWICVLVATLKDPPEGVHLKGSVLLCRSTKVLYKDR